MNNICTRTRDQTAKHTIRKRIKVFHNSPGPERAKHKPPSALGPRLLCQACVSSLLLLSKNIFLPCLSSPRRVHTDRTSSFVAHGRQASDLPANSSAASSPSPSSLCFSFSRAPPFALPLPSFFFPFPLRVFFRVFFPP